MASHFQVTLGLGRIDLENGKTDLQLGKGEFLEVGGLTPLALPSYFFAWDASDKSLLLAVLPLRFFQWVNEGYYPLHVGDCSVLGWVG